MPPFVHDATISFCPAQNAQERKGGEVRYANQIRLVLQGGGNWEYSALHCIARARVDLYDICALPRNSMHAGQQKISLIDKINVYGAEINVKL